jgi:RNA polymerase sigma-70 factor (ECF subfamily)
MARDDEKHKDLQPLLDRLAAGDESAVEPLIEHSLERLQRLAHFMLEQRPDVRRWYETGDVFQAAYGRLDRALRAERPASPRMFLGLAALQIRRELYDLARHEYGPEGSGKHHATGPAPGANQAEERPGGDAIAPGAGPATQAHWRDLLQHIQESLPEEEREVFDLLYVQELSQEEAAQVLGVSVPTVKRRWRSARLRLHDARVLQRPRPEAGQEEGD